MGLFNKLKNALFEEEEINLDPTPEKVVIKEEPREDKIIKTVEPPKKEEALEKPVVNKEHELFKTRNTFDFPDFDEDEFVTNYESTKPKESRVKRQEPILEKRQPENNYYESKTKTTREKSSKRSSKQEKKVDSVKKTFKPSPIISPVYGVLDKNYTKEDIMPAEKSIKNRKINDIDMARKKAFGSLEDEIEKTINEDSENAFYNNNKSIDDLLTESVDDTIELNYASREEKKKKEKRPDFSNSVEEDLDRVDENLEAIDGEEEFSTKKDLKSKEYDEEDTLENDLFDLIDSMYDNREEE